MEDTPLLKARDGANNIHPHMGILPRRADFLPTKEDMVLRRATHRLKEDSMHLRGLLRVNIPWEDLHPRMVATALLRVVFRRNSTAPLPRHHQGTIPGHKHRATHRAMQTLSGRP